MRSPDDTLRLTDPDDPSTEWHVERSFLESHWTCLWGQGCEGILPIPAAALGEGCCSVGAQLLDEGEAMTITALGAALDPARFQHHEAAHDGGLLDPPDGASGRSHWHTRVVDGACIFLNRPGFAGGAGCALHLGAEDEGEAPLDWKPSICWQLPLKIDTSGPDPESGVSVRSLRRWHTEDWNADDAERPCWTCTEAPEPGSSAPSAFVGSSQVIDSLADELEAMLGSRVLAELRAKMGRS